MARQKLTKTMVEAIPPADQDVVVWDEALPGFGVRVKPSGVRSYVVQYRSRESGASRRLTIGRHGPLLTFDQAKKRARTILADAIRGGDPAEERRRARDAPTMADLAADYLERHAIPKKRPKSVRDDRSMLDNIVLPRLRSKKVEAVTRRDVETIHVALRDRPYQANRVLALLSKMFNLAVDWGWRPDNPVKGIERYQEEKRDRWLSNEELRRLCEVLDGHPNQRAANAVRLQLLTGARLGEVLSARKDAFDLERGVWTKPSHLTKQRRTEHVPLSGQALALLVAIVEGVRSRIALPHSRATYPASLSKASRSSGPLRCARRASRTTAGTTTATPTPRTSSRAGSAWSWSGASWGTRRRPRPSATPTSPTIRCAPQPKGSEPRSPHFGRESMRRSCHSNRRHRGSSSGRQVHPGGRNAGGRFRRSCDPRM